MIDLVMWTLNGADTIDRSLESIGRAVPPKEVCHKLIVDGGSTDATLSIAQRHGWTVCASRPGIARQANLALSLVDSEFFGSFEQDILLSPVWFEKMSRSIFHPDVALAQGVRISVGSATVSAMDRENFRRVVAEDRLVSLDNTLCNTRAIRRVGGYRSSSMPGKGTDSLLLESIQEAGLRWTIDSTCISGHFRPSLAYHLRHCLRSYQLRLWQQGPVGDYLDLLSTSVIRGAKLAAKYHAPPVFLGYPLFRWTALVASLSGS